MLSEYEVSFILTQIDQLKKKVVIYCQATKESHSSSQSRVKSDRAMKKLTANIVRCQSPSKNNLASKVTQPSINVAASYTPSSHGSTFKL